jgi:hypothetical protein
MTTAPLPHVTVTLTYSDPDLDDEEREQLAQQLHHQLRAADSDLGTWRRVEAAPPPGSKSVAAQVVGALAAVLSAASLKSFFAYLGERWRGREISLELEVNGKKIKIVAHSQEDLLTAYNAAAALLLTTPSR